jgi:hypothetical protein
LGTQLKVAIDDYNKTAAAIPPGTKQDGVPDYAPFDTPAVKSENFLNIHLARRIRSTLETVEAEAVLRLKDAKSPAGSTVAPVIPPFPLLHGEFRMDLFHSQTNASLPCPQNGEVFLWQQVGFSEVYVHHGKGVESKPTPIPLKMGEVVLLSAANGPQTIRVRQLERGSCTLCVYNTTIKPQ